MAHRAASNGDNEFRSISRIAPAIIFFNMLLVAWAYLFSSDALKEERAFALEAGKAISWMVTASECERRGFCYEINANRSAGVLEHITVLSQPNTLSTGWSEIHTTTGTYHIQGLPITPHVNGELVHLYTEKGQQENVLCITDTCYLVPFNKKKH